MRIYVYKGRTCKPNIIHYNKTHLVWYYIFQDDQHIIFCLIKSKIDTKPIGIKIIIIATISCICPLTVFK